MKMIKKGLWLALCLSLFSVPLQPHAQETTAEELLTEAKKAVGAISVKDLKRLLDAKEKVVILDVRDMKEYKDGRIPGAVNISRASTMAPRLLEHHLQKIVPDKSANIIVYCMFAIRSPLTAKAMKDLGYTDVKYMDGGMKAWKEAGYPLEK